MTKSTQVPKKQNGGGSQNKSGKKGNNQPRSMTKQHNAILRMKPARPSEHKIKATFTDEEGEEVKELFYTLKDGEPKEILLIFESQLLKLGD